MTIFDGKKSRSSATSNNNSIVDETDETVLLNPVSIRWPLKDEYDFAIANWRHTVLDPQLRAGQLATDQLGICRYGGANLYVCIYRVSDWMVRCFRTNPHHPTPVDIQERYRAIAHFCETHTLSCLLPVNYIERGIRVGSRELPLVKMPFLNGCPSLGEFIMDNYQESEVMYRLCDAWLRMVRELEEAHIAHGDLDLTNVLVQHQEQQLTLKLIDYDNMWLPALSRYSQTEYGHVHFQHPAFMHPNPRPYTQEMDRFSAISIYISLRAIAACPELYDEYGANEDDRLLFSDYDYLNAGLIDSRMQQLRALNIPDLAPFLDELNSALRAKRMPCVLDDISTHKLIAVHGKQPNHPIAPATSLWGQAVYNANSLPGQPPFAPLPSMPPMSDIFPATSFTPASSLPPASTEQAPTWVLIALAVMCILLLISVVVIFVLIIQRQGMHPTMIISPFVTKQSMHIL